MEDQSGTGLPPREPGVWSTGPGYYSTPHYGGSVRSPAGNTRRTARQRSQRRRSSTGGGSRFFATAIIAGVVGALLVLLMMPAVFGVNPYDIVRGKLKNTTVVQKKTQTGQTVSVVSPSDGSMSVAAIAKSVTPSIVNIDIRTAPQQTPFFTTEGQEGTGSGVIYTSDGYIITNNHVVSDAQSITVTLASGQQLQGTLVGTDPANDIAVVKIDKKGLPAIPIGDSSNLAVGQLAVAVGSPYGFEQTVTSGIVSALHRSISGADEQGYESSTLSDLIQTDASINPGNSGGALCDGNAKLIGINAVIASSSGGSEGVGFAIPVNTVKKSADSIISGRTVSNL
jgi:S1-C subfamily serine protease